MKLPRIDSASLKGEHGLTIVKNIVEQELQWIFRKNHQEHDFGIDAYIDVISKVGEITGKSIALQIKTGASFFKERNQFGWVYRGSSAHLNYYLNHDIPVVIVIVNEKEEHAYWCLCDASKTEQAGENWKITIPFKQRLNNEVKDALKQYISPVIDYVSQMEHYWALNKAIRESGIILFIVEKEEIESLDYSIVAAFQRFAVTHELMHHSEAKVDILIHGYDNDSRELRDIPEVQKWVVDSLLEIPGLMFFISKKDNSQFFRVLQLCTHGFKVLNTVKGKNNKPAHDIEISLENSELALDLMFDNLNDFCDSYGIDDEVNEKISGEIFAFLYGKDFPIKPA